MNKILAGRDKIPFARVARVGVRLPRGILFWNKCLGSMSVFVKDETIFGLHQVEGPFHASLEGCEEGSDIELVNWARGCGGFEHCGFRYIEGRVRRQLLQSQKERGRLLPRQNPRGRRWSPRLKRRL